MWERAGSSLRTDLKLAGDFELWLRFFDHAQLHILQSVIGAFRIRRSNQFSLEKLDEYNHECESEIQKKLERLTYEEKNNLRFLKMYWRVYSRIPILNKEMTHKFTRILNQPPVVVYNRQSQSFFLK